MPHIQWLMGCLAALSCFMSRLGERGLPLYKLLKKSDSFRWMDEMQRALDNLKILISKPPALASPEPSETLLLYVATTTQVISAALVVEWEEPRHIYKVHQRSTTSTKYSPTARPTTIKYKSYFTPILIMKWKLLHYFESHPIHVVTSFGLGEIVGNRLTTGRIAKWALLMFLMQLRKCMKLLM
jgi:hypothetical protein